MGEIDTAADFFLLPELERDRLGRLALLFRVPSAEESDRLQGPRLAHLRGRGSNASGGGSGSSSLQNRGSCFGTGL